MELFHIIQNQLVTTWRNDPAYRRTTLVQLRQTEPKMHKFATVKKFDEKKISSHSFGFMSMLQRGTGAYTALLHRNTAIFNFLKRCFLNQTWFNKLSPNYRVLVPLLSRFFSKSCRLQFTQHRKYIAQYTVVSLIIFQISNN
jgi:hypothetical protein